MVVGLFLGGLGSVLSVIVMPFRTILISQTPNLISQTPHFDFPSAQLDLPASQFDFSFDFPNAQLDFPNAHFGVQDSQFDFPNEFLEAGNYCPNDGTPPNHDLVTLSAFGSLQETMRDYRRSGSSLQQLRRFSRLR